MALSEFTFYANRTHLQSRILLPARHGNVSFAIVGTTVPGLLQNINITQDITTGLVIDGEWVVYLNVSGLPFISLQECEFAILSISG